MIDPVAIVEVYDGELPRHVIDKFLDAIQSLGMAVEHVNPEDDPIRFEIRPPAELARLREALANLVAVVRPIMDELAGSDGILDLDTGVDRIELLRGVIAVVEAEVGP